MFRTTWVSTLTFVFSASAFAADLSLEPCMDGGVSASGNFPTQEMEEQISAYLDWASDQPGYLLAISPKALDPAAEHSAPVSELR